jgi:moderate conductance mechanosensitive channel
MKFARSATAPLLFVTSGTQAHATPSQAHVLSGLVGGLEAVRDHLQSLLVDIAEAPEQARQLFGRLREGVQTGEGVRAFTYIVILFLIGAGIEWLYRTYAHASIRSCESMAPGTPGEALKLGLKRLFLRLFGLVLFALSIIAVSTGFVWPNGVQDVVLTGTLAIFLIRLLTMLVGLLVAPRLPALQLLPVSRANAIWTEWIAVGLGADLIIGWLIPDLFDRVMNAGHLAQCLRILTATIALLAALVAIAHFGNGAVHKTGPRRAHIPKTFFTATAVVASYLFWLGGGFRIAASLAILGVVIGMEIVLRQLVEFFWPVEKLRIDPIDGAASGVDLPLLPGVILRLARLFVASAGLVSCALIWELPVVQMPGDESAFGKFATRMLGVIALALVADVAWAAARGAIDSRMRGISALDEDGEPGPNARLVTLLPLMRKAIGVTLLGLLILSSLSMLGVEITPLLAGAGVIGIAVGFGAQTLVRDLIAGVFFLVEDVFRVGEYIESGSNTKGTVERITLRTVALRHHNGPLHFVPYGALGAVRNNSRDWVVDKFNLPLPIETDSEMLRKLVKKIGQKLMEDPELGPHILSPLKATLYRVDPGVKVFRCKVQTQPGKQFDVRAAAYKHIEAALREAGIRYAEMIPTVHVGTPAEPFPLVERGQAVPDKGQSSDRPQHGEPARASDPAQSGDGAQAAEKTEDVDTSQQSGERAQAAERTQTAVRA